MSGAPTEARTVLGTGEARRHLIVAIVNNKPGVLNRVASLMRARSFNIESLAVSVTERPDASRMTIAIIGDEVQVLGADPDADRRRSEHARRQEVHRRRADELGDEHTRRTLVHLLRCADLLEPTMIEHGDAGAHQIGRAHV